MKSYPIQVALVSFYFRFLDFLMVPVMWAFSGFKLEFPQETHRWHMQNISCEQVRGKSVAVMGDDKSKVGTKAPFIHLPILGGWKNYVVLKAEGFSNHWFVGWKKEFINGRKTVCQIQKLRIHSPYIKLLKGVADSKKYFFGLDEKGEFIELKKIGEGILGDGKFRTVRLF